MDMILLAALTGVLVVFAVLVLLHGSKQRERSFAKLGREWTWGTTATNHLLHSSHSTCDSRTKSAPMPESPTIIPAGVRPVYFWPSQMVPIPPGMYSPEHLELACMEYLR